METTISTTHSTDARLRKNRERAEALKAERLHKRAKADSRRFAKLNVKRTNIPDREIDSLFQTFWEEENMAGVPSRLDRRAYGDAFDHYLRTNRSEEVFIWIIRLVILAAFVYGVPVALRDSESLPDRVLYPVITAKLCDEQNGWRLQTSRGPVSVPYRVYQEHKPGDRLKIQTYTRSNRLECGEPACLAEEPR
jgi:hypothetical protein